MVKEIIKKSYKERLAQLKLPTLKYRRYRGDMIETFKILNGYYDVNIIPNLVKNLDTRTRGNCLKLAHTRANLETRKHSFCSRIVTIWNSLPNNIVMSTSINSFKNVLDKYWCDQEVL